MAAGGFREFVAGETLDEDDINDFLMQGMLVFAGTAARGSAITAPVEGQFSFLSDSDAVEFYDGTDWVALESGAVSLNYLVIAGGAGGGGNGGGGGGAGGYRCSVSGEDTGGGATADLPLSLALGTYSLRVGAGGNGSVTIGGDGVLSQLASVVAVGGGGGGRGNLAGVTPGAVGGSGGGGGGFDSTNSSPGGAGTLIQGFAGGTSSSADPYYGAGGGGGADAVGGNGTSSAGGAGGAGLPSSITGSSVTRGVGGAGSGATGGAGAAGTVNLGNGGAGGSNGGFSGGNGGSGVVIFSLPPSVSVSFSGGVTQSSATVGDNTVYTVTATSTTSETVTFA